jgi:hypothetical protein
VHERKAPPPAGLSAYSSAMEASRRITGFRRDDEGQWIAELECGHTVHVRHDPPWQVRPWVQEAASRNARLGSSVECVRCVPESRVGHAL